DDCAALSRAVFDRARDFLANNRAHRGSEKTEIHDRDRDLIAVENAVSADHSIEQAGALLIFFQPILVCRHSLKAQHVNGFQVGVHFYKTIRIEQTLDSLPGRLRMMIIAARTDTLILRELSFRNNLSAAGALLKQTARNFPLFAGLRLNRWFFKNRHGGYA